MYGRLLLLYVARTINQMQTSRIPCGIRPICSMRIYFCSYFTVRVQGTAELN